MESQPQNPEFSNNPENFQPCVYCFTFGLVLDASCLLSLPAVFLFPLGGVVLLSRLLIVFTSLDDVSLPESSPLHKSEEVHDCTVKPVLSGHSKKDRKLVYKTDYRLMQVQRIAECSKRAFCSTSDLHLAIICL